MKVNARFYLALFIAILLDLFDFLIVGLIPGLGDIADIIGIAVLFPLIGPASLLGVFEFIPIIGDLSPTFVVAVLLSKTPMFAKLNPFGKQGGKSEV
jgi:hypothetical protein